MKFTHSNSKRKQGKFRLRFRTAIDLLSCRGNYNERESVFIAPALIAFRKWLHRRFRRFMIGQGSSFSRFPEISCFFTFQNCPFHE